MEAKHSEQIKCNEWYLITILEIVAPIACLTFALGHSGLFLEYILDNTKPKASPYQINRWLINLLSRPFRSVVQTHFKEANSNHGSLIHYSPEHIWRDGSLLCTLVNVVVPGACKDPRDHWKKPPRHGVQLVMEYLDIQAIFTNEDYEESILSFQKEKLFGKYLTEVYNTIEKQIEHFSNMRFSTDYVARGMGLVIGEQNCKSTFYIYPIPKHNYHPSDLEVYIKGPCGNNGHITIPSILHHANRFQPATDYTRAMYMSSKLNSISPTIQGTSFLRRLSLTKSTEQTWEVDIRVKMSSTRAKVTYVPQKTGIYEIKLVTRDCHVVGSPYTVPIELPTSRYFYNNSSESEEENEGKYIKRKKKIISRIVDYMDEKNKKSQNDILKQNENNNDTKTESKNITNNLHKEETKEIILDESNNSEIKNNSLENNILKELHNSEDIMYFSESYLDINQDEKINTFAPDILVTFNKNKEKSVPFTEHVNEIQNCISLESIHVDPTLLKVHDPTLDFPTNISKYRKTFSKKDPSKDVPTPEISNDINEKTYVVNHLVKVFDSQNTEENECMSEICNPDLVTCHIKQENTSSHQKETIGTLSEDYVDHQGYLKDCLQEQCIKDIKSEEIEKQSDILGIVDKQKQFWNEKLNYSKKDYIESTKQKVILKDSFIVETKTENKQRSFKNFEPFEGIVGNKIKIFENNLVSCNNHTPNKRLYELLEIRKSKSESFLQTPKDDELYQKHKTVSNEEIIKIPTIEERKIKFLQACQQLYSPTKNSVKKIDVKTKIVQNEICNNLPTLKIEHDENKNRFSDEERNKESTDDEKRSFGRKARFKRAKQFFHNLEESYPNLSSTELLEKDVNNKISRSESDTCVSYNTKSYKITDRFPVDDLYQDILGDDRRFFGIPNKMAVVASLATLDSDSSKADYSDNDGEEPDLDYFKGTPKTVKRRKKNVPGFYGEYPYLPTTDTWRFKSRGSENTNILIPGRKLLKTKSTDLSNVL